MLEAKASSFVFDRWLRSEAVLLSKYAWSESFKLCVR